MNAVIWIGSRPLAVCAAYKKDLLLQPWQTAIQIAFRFETVWCVADQSSALLLTDGSLLPTTKVYTQGKVLIGRDDAYQTGLDYNDDAKVFRAALDEREREKSRAAVSKLLNQ